MRRLAASLLGWSAAQPALVQNAPTGTDKTITIDEDTPHTFSTSDFGFNDDDTDDTLDSVTIVTLPGAGSLELGDATVTANQEVDESDIGNLVFTPALNENGNGYASFTFKVSDGTDLSAVANTITFNVTAVNDPAKGAPEISGFPQDGQTLTASAGTIEDVDGLTGPTYGYQWIRVDGSTENDISGANSSTYTPVAADVGKTLKVKLTFQDDAGNDEERTSEETEEVVAAARACTTGNVWCATLTVALDPHGSAHGYCDTAAGTCDPAYGSLSDTGFTLDGTDYVVESLRWAGAAVGAGIGASGPRLHLTLDRDLPAARLGRLTLRVDTHPFALDEAGRGNSSDDVDNNYRWQDPPRRSGTTWWGCR